MTRTMNDYEDRAAGLAIYPGRGTLLGLAYVGLGLGEAGEVQGKIKKVLRDEGGHLTAEHREAILDELGDVLWYVTMAAVELDSSLREVAKRNLSKLESRAERGVLGGSGDSR